MFIYVLGILEHDSKILLLLRQNTKFFSGYYGLPGGKIEHNESVASALIRELNEEIGVTIQLKNLHFAHCLSWKSETNEEILVIVFKITLWQGEIINKEPDKCAAIDWFHINQLPNNIIPRHLHIIQMIQKSMLYSESGW